MRVSIFCLLVICLLVVIFPSRIQAATYTVTKTADTSDGTCNIDCSFREALAASEANAGTDTIEFAIPLSDTNYNLPSFPNAFVIQPTTPFESFDESLVVDGSTQTDFTGDSNIAVANTTTGPEIIFDFSLLVGSTPIALRGSIYTFSSIGIYNTPSSGGRPITIPSSAVTSVTITDSTFIGNRFGVYRNSSSNVVVLTVTNSIFRDNSGQPVFETTAGAGITLDSNTFILNAVYSFYVNGSTSPIITIQNNLFKENSGGNEIGAVANATYLIQDNIFQDKLNTKPVIEVTGVTAKATIRRNVMTNSIGIPINLSGGTEDSSKVTANDLGDIDTGANDLMNFPVIDHANYLGGGRYAVGGMLDGRAQEAPFTIEVCESDNHGYGYGGCSQSLATISVTASNWEVFVTVDGDNEHNLSSFTALATNANGSTSEFSGNFRGRLAEPVTASASPTPDLSAENGGVVTKNEVISIALTHTFIWDSVLSTIFTPKAQPYNLPGTRWWQASGTYEIWWKAFANDARIISSEVKQPFIVALKYNPAELESTLPERNLRLAFSADEGKTWKLVTHSVLDMVNKTVATVTKEGGWYMLVSGHERWSFLDLKTQ